LIRTVIDEHFGPGTGERVQFHCEGDGDRLLIQELRFHFQGIISADADIGALLLAADSQTLGCPRGVVDPSGLQ